MTLPRKFSIQAANRLTTCLLKANEIINLAEGDYHKAVALVSWDYVEYGYISKHQYKYIIAGLIAIRACNKAKELQS